MATYTEALSSIPAAAEWSSSFGNPGEGGYTEYHRTQSGERWVVGNGPYDTQRPFDWTARRLEGGGSR